MRKNFRKLTVLSVVSVIMLVTVLASACDKQETAAIPPFVPPEYYDCMEVDPLTLLDIYFTGYAGFETIEAQYNDKYYVFKDILVEERTLRGLDEGYIWVDNIKCYLVDVNDMKRFEVGDRVDVVGLNKGPESYTGAAQLKFEECLVLPAGTVALPADPDAGAISPGY